VGWFSTTIELGAGDVPLRETTVLATVSRRSGPDIGFDVGIGAIVDGQIGDHDGDVSAGFAASAAVTWLARYEGERSPFVLIGGSLAGSRAEAVSDDGERHALCAFDLRAGAMVGKTLGPVTVYAAARVFGGPVSWTLAGEETTGGDAHHYTVGAGATVRAGRFSLALEGMALGERSATLGVGLAL
jgi:hypothetical protein